MTRRPTFADSMIAQHTPTVLAGEMVQIWPGISDLYRIVIAHPNGDYETVCECSTDLQAINARDEAKAAAADALIALSEIGRTEA